MTGCSVHYLFWGISIHAPTRGATRVCGLYRILNHDFNPRSHEGSDYLPVTVSGGNAISIHAPTRGATLVVLLLSRYSRFQSTLPRGERRKFTGWIRLGIRNFNPRSHEGSDSNFRQKVLFSLSKNCLKYLILTTNYFK